VQTYLLKATHSSTAWQAFESGHLGLSSTALRPVKVFQACCSIDQVVDQVMKERVDIELQCIGFLI
jgi:hypothetical protein